jgi:hypothetical protein
MSHFALSAKTELIPLTYSWPKAAGRDMLNPIMRPTPHLVIFSGCISRATGISLLWRIHLPQAAGFDANPSQGKFIRKWLLGNIINKSGNTILLCHMICFKFAIP